MIKMLVITTNILSNMIKDKPQNRAVMFKSFILNKVVPILDEESQAMVRGHRNAPDARCLPELIFSAPHGKVFELAAYGNEGFGLLQKIKAALHKIRKIDVGVDDVVYIDNMFFVDGITMPVPSEKKLSYFTATPLVLMTGRKHKISYAIQHSAMSEEEKITELKRVSVDLIKNNIHWILKRAVKNKDYSSLLDELEINWTHLQPHTLPYHQNERSYRHDGGLNLTLALTGKFTSNMELPKFIGQKTSLGFGNIALDKKPNEWKVPNA